MSWSSSLFATFITSKLIDDDYSFNCIPAQPTNNNDMHTILYESIDEQERRNHFYVFLVGFAQALTLQMSEARKKIKSPRQSLTSSTPKKNDRKSNGIAWHSRMGTNNKNYSRKGWFFLLSAAPVNSRVEWKIPIASTPGYNKWIISKMIHSLNLTVFFFLSRLFYSSLDFVFYERTETKNKNVNRARGIHNTLWNTETVCHCCLVECV